MILRKILSATAIISTSVFLSACGSNNSHDSKPMKVATPTMSQTSAGFQKLDRTVGTGATAQAGQTVIVHYTGWLFDAGAPGNKGKKFDSSVDRGRPFDFPLGAGRVIKGWDNGFEGMQVGGKRTLIIPPQMGYGQRGAGDSIPPNATLLFDVELLGVK